MSFLRSILTTTVVAALLGLSCFAYADPPAESGNVIRFEGAYASYWYDPDTDMTAYIGFDPQVLCTTGQWIADPVSIMEVWHKDGARFKARLSSQLSVYVYASVPSCAVILANDPIAYGVGNFRLNDNDVDPSLNPDRNNMNSFGVSTNGFLSNYATGERMRFLLQWHAMWDGIDFESYREIIKIKLN